MTDITSGADVKGFYYEYLNTKHYPVDCIYNLNNLGSMDLAKFNMYKSLVITKCRCDALSALGPPQFNDKHYYISRSIWQNSIDMDENY
jgi:hypothetical protein